MSEFPASGNGERQSPINGCAMAAYKDISFGGKPLPSSAVLISPMKKPFQTNFSGKFCNYFFSA